MKPRYLVAAFLSVLASTPVCAQSVKAGIDAWQRADYGTAAAIWRPLAEKGDPDAEFNLGQAYRLGRGVPINLGMAKSWFEKAAGSGHLDAETTLGLLLFQNGEQADGIKWLRRAAEQGEPRALLVYGTALYNGDGVTQDRLLGYAFVSRSAQQGLKPAKDTLEELDGLMSEADRKKAMLLAAARPAAVAMSAKANKPQAIEHSKPKVEPAATMRARQLAEGRAVQSKEMSRAQAKPKIDKPRPQTAALTSPARGNWRIQLGAFAQHKSAEALYRKIANNAALSGRGPIYVPVAAMTRLQIGPFENRASAASACRAIGNACFPIPAK